jgi:hypothetical protein
MLTARAAAQTFWDLLRPLWLALLLVIGLVGGLRGEAEWRRTRDRRAPGGVDFGPLAFVFRDGVRRAPSRLLLLGNLYVAQAAHFVARKQGHSDPYDCETYEAWMHFIDAVRFNRPSSAVPETPGAA